MSAFFVFAGPRVGVLISVLPYFVVIGWVQAGVAVCPGDFSCLAFSDIEMLPAGSIAACDGRGRLTLAVVEQDLLSSAGRFCVRFVSPLLSAVRGPARAADEVKDTEDKSGDEVRIDDFAIV
jgi:hypothetical protein